MLDVAPACAGGRNCQGIAPVAIGVLPEERQRDHRGCDEDGEDHDRSPVTTPRFHRRAAGTGTPCLSCLNAEVSVPIHDATSTSTLLGRG